MDLTKDLLEKHRIQGTIISAYHPQSNGLVERGHDSITNALAKYDKAHWTRYLPLVLWADRISVRRSTGYSAFELVYGRECLLPVQFSVPSWCMVDWGGEVKTREDLLVARIRQLDQRALDESRAAENLESSRKQNKEYFDTHNRLRGHSKLQVGDLVLMHTGKRKQSRKLTEKLDDYWIGPYRIREIPENSTFYYLEELDGTQLSRSIVGNRLKKFFSRTILDEGRNQLHNVIRVRDEEQGEGDDEELDDEDRDGLEDEE